jgi:hypothetical protein
LEAIGAALGSLPWRAGSTRAQKEKPPSSACSTQVLMSVPEAMSLEAGWR